MVLFVGTLGIQVRGFQFYIFSICDLPFFLFAISYIVNCFSQSASVELLEVHWQPPGMPRKQARYLWSCFTSFDHLMWRYLLLRTNKNNKKDLWPLPFFKKINSKDFKVHVMTPTKIFPLSPECLFWRQVTAGANRYRISESRYLHMYWFLKSWCLFKEMQFLSTL